MPKLTEEERTARRLDLMTKALEALRDMVKQQHYALSACEGAIVALSQRLEKLEKRPKMRKPGCNPAFKENNMSTSDDTRPMPDVKP